MSNKLGIEIIRELQSRKIAGRYFNFGELRKLKKVANKEELAELLSKTPYEDIQISSDPSQIVDDISSNRQSHDWFFFWTDLLGHLLFMFG